MPLIGFSVSGYRSFLRKTDIELRPLTLLFGYNSAGKSALLRLLPLVADSIASGSRGPLNLSSPGQRGALFEDIVSVSAAARAIGLGLRFRSSALSRASGELEATWLIRDIPEVRTQVVEDFTVRQGDGAQCRAVWVPKRDSRGMPADEYELTCSDGLNADVSFAGLTPRVTLPDEASSDSGSYILLRDLADALGGLPNGVQWIGATREVLSRRFRVVAPPVGAMDPFGKHAAELLAQDHWEQGPILNEVSSAYRRILNHSLELSGPDDALTLLLSSMENISLRVPLVDTGEGMTQLLPVLVACARAYHSLGPRLVAMEQPELHLHPGTHEPLAGYFCDLVSGEDPPSLVVETHSENLLLGVLLRIAQGEFDPERVVVYWVHTLSDGRSRAERITYDTLARPQGPWPPEVFSEDTALARAIVEERTKREDDAP
jgi:hypothetical protein